MRRAVEKFLGPAGTANESTRITWIQRALEEVPAGHRVLDAGAGERQFRRFCGHLEYVSQDFAQYDPALVPGGLHPTSWNIEDLDIVSDITAIPEPDGSFDAVLCTEVLEHVPYPARALTELARLLRPGGLLICTAPFCSLTHFAPYHFHTGFSRYFYEYVLDELGLDLVELTANGNYFEYLAQELRRLPKVSATYSNAPRPLGLRVAAALVVRALSRLSSGDRGSDELLAYGFHVRARRRI